MTTPVLVEAGHLGDPLRSPETEEFWRGCAEGVLLVQDCGACGSRQYPWGPVCRRCWSTDLAGTASSGHGVLWSYTVIDRAPDQDFAGSVPYVVALVELAEGPRMMARVVGVSEDSLRPGLPLRLAFARSASGATILPVFVAPDRS